MNIRFTTPIALSLLILSGSLSARAQSPTAPAQSDPLESSATRPRGIDASAWVPITDKFGFVITKSPPKQGTMRVPGTTKDIPVIPNKAPTVAGYFMIFSDGRWLRIEADLPPARFFPAQ